MFILHSQIKGRQIMIEIIIIIMDWQWVALP